MPFKDPQKRREYGREWVRKRKALWFERNGPCVLCGSWKDLEIDHIDPTIKTTHRIWSWSKEKREAELAKCQVLCQSCHKEKTAEEKESPHGTFSRYIGKHKCKCQECRKANAEHTRTQREKNRTVL